MVRPAFKLSPSDRTSMHILPDASGVSVNLGAKDGDDGIEIIEVDDTPEADRGRPTEVGDSILDQEDDLREQVSERTRKRFDRLKFETETQRRGREMAERERDAAVELARRQNDELTQARRQIDTGGTALFTSMKAERESRIADAQRRLTQAHADGDNEAITKATSDLSLAQAELVAISARAPAVRAEQPEQRAAPQAQPSQQPRLAPEVDRWIQRNNNWFQQPGNEAKSAKAMSLHYDLVARGVPPNDPRYIRELDKGLKAVYPEHQPFSGSSDDGDGGAGRSTQPRRTNVVTEGSRDSPVSRGDSQRVELSSSEVAIANKLRVPLKIYAAEKAKREAAEKGAER